MSEGLLQTFGWPANPCDDCIDLEWGKECTMNCSGPRREPDKDFGSIFITREKNGTVTVRVRQPYQRNESLVNLPADIWESMIAQKPTLEEEADMIDGLGSALHGRP